MRHKWIRQLDWAILFALALAVVAAGPFLARPGLPRETDAELHVYRAAQLGQSVRAGVLYPRWAPDLYFGYGYPILNYYAPLTYYLANLFALLPGVGIVGGVKAVFVLGLCVAALGAYLLGRELFGPAAGVVAAASFTFAPYILFIDPHARGDLAEHFAVCLFPVAFYAFRRLMGGGGGRGAFAGSVLALAALVFSHNLLGLVASGLLAGYWAWEVVAGAGRQRAGRGVLAFALAAAIIAFFWLPALLERSAVELNVVGPGHFDFHEHFLSLGELLAPSRILDLGAAAPRYRFNLGLAQWLLALPALGAVILFCKGAVSPASEGGWRVLPYFSLAGLGLVFLMLPVSTMVWEHVPWMAYLQFPWRLLGAANLMLAVCAAGSVALFSTWRWRGPLLAVVLGVILALALPLLYPPAWGPEFGGTRPQDIIEWEQHSLALGTTSTSDFLPVGAAQGPIHPEPTLIASYAGPGPVDKVNRATLPDGTVVKVIEHGPQHDRFATSSPKEFVLRLYTFYFPGWRATVDGQEVQIEVARPEGFITLQVPAGQHEVSVRLEDTPPRTVGWIVSAIGLVALLVVLVCMRVPRAQEAIQETGFFGRRSDRTRFLDYPVWLMGVLLLFVIVKGGVIDLHDNWMRTTSPPGQAWAAQHEERAMFVPAGAEVGEGQIELVGYDLPRPRVQSGGTLSVWLYWHALKPVDANYQSFVHLARPPHILWGQEDHLNPGDLPTTRWPLDKYVWDEYEVHILPGTPPGIYALNVGLYSMAGGYRLQHYGEGEQPAGDSLVLASIEVERPRRQPRPSELGLTQEMAPQVFPEGGITLLGYAEPYPKVKLPGVWPITLFWRADSNHPAARVRDLVLLDAAGNEVWRFSGVPADYPFEMWQAGEVVRDPILFAAETPVSLTTGKYSFGVVIDGGDWVPLGEVKFRVKENE